MIFLLYIADRYIIIIMIRLICIFNFLIFDSNYLLIINWLFNRIVTMYFLCTFHQYRIWTDWALRVFYPRSGLKPMKSKLAYTHLDVFWWNSWTKETLKNENTWTKQTIRVKHAGLIRSAATLRLFLNRYSSWVWFWAFLAFKCSD